MITGLHSRKKNLNHDDSFDPEDPLSPLKGGGDDEEVKTHGRVNVFRGLLRSEVGCAIEAVVGFLIFGLFLGYMILHHQHRKVRFSCFE